jgi:hypothetical protein
MITPKPELLAHLNQETGRMAWADVEPHFARGVVVKVSAELDLVKVAAAMTIDDKENFVHWMQTGQVARASSEDAIRWQETQAEFWAVVVAPWVVVQEIGKVQ